MMATENRKVRIAAVGDIHVTAADKGNWTDYFRAVSQKADVLLICGDLTNTGDEAEAQVLSDELRLSCTIPVVTVLGNHDHEKGRQKLVRQTIQNERVYVLDGESVIIQNIGFAGVKGFGGGFGEQMLSMFGESGMKNFVQEAVNETLHLERALNRLDQEQQGVRKIALLHYAPEKKTVTGEPESLFPFLGCSRLAEPIIRRQVLAVFHGHAHRGNLAGELSGGTKVFNVAKPLLLREGYDPPFYVFEV
jgi:Icc-related predicted phosphoesterase